jgi:hypothetical protein
VQSVLLIDVGDQGAMLPQIDLASRNIRLLRAPEAKDEVDDVVIEMGGVLDAVSGAPECSNRISAW